MLSIRRCGLKNFSDSPIKTFPLVDLKMIGYMNMQLHASVNIQVKTYMIAPTINVSDRVKQSHGSMF